jgi:hypothetical protein
MSSSTILQNNIWAQFVANTILVLLSCSLLSSTEAFLAPSSSKPVIGWSILPHRDDVNERFECRHCYHSSPNTIISTPTIIPTTTTRLFSSTWSKQQQQQVSPSSLNNVNSNTALGANKRVKAILEKAKTRTGISNINSESSMKNPVSGSNPNNNNNRSGYGVTSTSRQLASISTSFSLNDYDFTALGFEESYTTKSVVSNYDMYTPNPSTPTTIESSRTSRYNDVEKYTSKPLQEDDTSSKLINRITSVDMATVSPLPFTLPDLTDQQRQILASGQRVEEQASMSREGSGYVVMDIPAPDYVIWEALLDFEAYPHHIDTVRSMRMFTNQHLKQSYVAEQPLPPSGRPTRHYGTGCITRASFVLSKFHLTIAAIHKYVPHPDGHYMEFTLDKACKNMVLQDAKGIWYTQSIYDDQTKQTYTRLWLLCELHVSNMLPQFIVDYASSKAMPRATTWITPAVERLRKEFQLDTKSTRNGDYLA